MKLKHKLPPYANLVHLNLFKNELDEMKNIIVESKHLFESVLEANKKLCGIHHDLTKQVYDNFFQISLTESKFNLDKTNLNQCETDAQNYQGLKGFKLKKFLAERTGSGINEKDYNIKTEFYLKNQLVFDKIIGKFKSIPTRIRLVKLNSGTSISPHIDYDPEYAVRIIIPIVSDDNCLNLFWVKNKIETINFIEGKAYFLNTGYKHAVINFSKNDRYTFMISLKGTADIETLLS